MTAPRWYKVEEKIPACSPLWIYGKSLDIPDRGEGEGVFLARYEFAWPEGCYEFLTVESRRKILGVEQWCAIAQPRWPR